MFENRVDAGRRLARVLRGRYGAETTVLGLPRGGVPVAAEVAAVLGSPLDVLVVRKVGVPAQPEVAMGAVGEGGVTVVDPGVVRRVGGDRVFDAEAARERAVVADRATRLRRGRPALNLHGRTAIVVDDGIATGATARAASAVARSLGAARVVVATPVAPPGLAPGDLGADDLVCLERPAGFWAVGRSYRDFTQVADQEVADLLAVGSAG